VRYQPKRDGERLPDQEAVERIGMQSRQLLDRDDMR
jgi:hypothetical protein